MFSTDSIIPRNSLSNKCSFMQFISYLQRKEDSCYIMLNKQDLLLQLPFQFPGIYFSNLKLFLFVSRRSPYHYFIRILSLQCNYIPSKSSIALRVVTSSTFWDHNDSDSILYMVNLIVPGTTVVNCGLYQPASR